MTGLWSENLKSSGWVVTSRTWTLGERMKKSMTVAFAVTARQMALIDEDGRRVVEPGRFRLHAGGRQPDGRSAELAGTRVLAAEFEVTGGPLPLPY